MGLKKTKLLMENISIEFPGVKALSGVRFEMETGQIHALIGANGAGKSTLMKVLSGAYDHYTGEIYLDDEKVDIRSPREAKALGIDIVYQEVDTALIPDLSVAENIMLDVLVNQMNGRQLVSWKEIYRTAAQTLERLNIRIDLRERVENLHLADKQMVLIARAIVEDRKFLILDEPTAPLSQTETTELFRVVKDLALNHDVGIIFISHRLPEIFAICESITVMKDGQLVKRCSLEGMDSKQIVELMLGRQFHERQFKFDVEVGDPLLDVQNLTDKTNRIKDVNIHVCSGEIVGVAGLVGAGKTELCKTLFGALPTLKGEVRLKGRKLKINNPHQAVRQGLALVPEERRKEGVLVEEPVYRNISAASLGTFTGFLSSLKPRKEKAAAKEMIRDLGIKTPNELQEVALLSGGNQQKVAVAKWLISDADLYIFDEPTKGVDVGAKGDIFALIGELVRKQKGIIYASSELSEIMAITDRVYVMYDGQIVKELETAKTSEEEILYYSTGGE